MLGFQIDFLDHFSLSFLGQKLNICIQIHFQGTNDWLNNSYSVSKYIQCMYI